MHDAWIAVVAKVRLQKGHAGMPVIGVPGVKVQHGAHHPRVFAGGGDQGQTGGDQFERIGFLESSADQRGNEAPPVDTIAIVRDARRPRCQVSGESRVARDNQPPNVAEDLPTDLLGQGCPVLRDRSTARRGNATGKIEVGSVLGRNAVATPPQRAMLIAQVVEPGIGDLLR
jgi:hypothetical protein